MKRSIKTVLAGLLAVPVLALGISAVSPVLSQTAFAACVDANGVALTGAKLGACQAKGSDQSTSLFGNGGIFQTITNTALYIIGAISVLMLIYGGIRYTISMGDAKNVEAAKNTILYAIIGIVVALLAYAIVNFVLASLIK